MKAFVVERYGKAGLRAADVPEPEVGDGDVLVKVSAASVNPLDKMVPTKNTIDLDQRLPNSQLVMYPDAGHGGVFQFHADFVKRALEFLRGKPS